MMIQPQPVLDTARPSVTVLRAYGMICRRPIVLVVSAKKPPVGYLNRQTGSRQLCGEMGKWEKDARATNTRHRHMPVYQSVCLSSCMCLPK